MQKLVKLSVCPVCGGKNFVQTDLSIEPSTPFYKLIPEGETLGCSRCIACSFLFQNPRLARREVEEEYGDSTYRRRDGEIVIDEGYLRYSPTQLTRYFFWLLSIGLDLREIKSQTCLDYGCGIGGALNFMAENGNTLYGVEVDRALAQYGNDHFSIKISNRVEDLPGEARFDFAFSHHSLEHVYDPNDFVQFAAERMTAEGVLVIVVPTWRYSNTLFSLNQVSCEHYSGFDHVSLSRLLNKHGFYMMAHNYQNTSPQSPEWELCAVAVPSSRKNHYSSTLEADLAEYERNAPARAADRDAPHRLNEKISVMEMTLAQARQ